MIRTLTANEAAQLLGVSKATLYAYVSRNLIRSEAAGGQSRARRYLAEDVQKLLERKEYRRNPAQVAQDALHWGTPLLDSALTLITETGLYYRGQSVTELARSARFEEVAALLWTADAANAEALFSQRPGMPKQPDMHLPPLQRATVALAQADDLAAYNLRPEAVARSGGRILALMAAALTGTPLGAGNSLARHFAQCWQPDDSHLPRLIDAALILCADHELNVSSFTARVVASSDATPYAVVIAGLAALSGFKHGGNTERVEALFREVDSEAQIARVVAERLRRGETIPGFGHSLYPDGDPRAAVLLELLAGAYPDAVEIRFASHLAQRVSAVVGQRANIDYALVALAHVSRLPQGAPLALFALGRTAGWIAHAIEHYSSGALIRPRARYVGEPPEN
jgi:citrate synthase